jgi:hypothetical protein
LNSSRIGIERALGEELRAADLPRLGLEHVDEQPADRLALGLRVGDAGQRVKEQRRGIGMDQRDVVAVAEQPHDLGPLVLAQQAVVDEHALELVADRLVQQHGHHRGVDAAREAADHLAGADQAADLGDGALAERGHRPLAAAAGDVEREVAQQPGAVGRVHHLGMELHRVVAPRLVGDRRERRVLAGGDHREAGRQLGDAVAVAHPDLLAVAWLPDAVEQRRLRLDLDLGAAELAMVARLDLAAELVRHGLLAVADAQDGHVGGKDRGIGGRRLALDHRGRAARQDDAARVELLDVARVD